MVLGADAMWLSIAPYGQLCPKGGMTIATEILKSKPNSSHWHTGIRKLEVEMVESNLSGPALCFWQTCYPKLGFLMTTASKHVAYRLKGEDWKYRDYYNCRIHDDLSPA
ncbi:PREDICTED: uncharacterized protein LOC105597571 isoform X2 [Cercocebus atys]|uniref:uncharacterized protein LOC105597571 isoform X2 n=1 Tax=Cercocebus atys TaxID=9531 RepID=UPI0005F429E9|nr:PREDICTED: uncharacterized protein LOC105597571 isoform X2 [Cercocebus atys]